jgi:hypothetical protein
MPSTPTRRPAQRTLTTEKPVTSATGWAGLLHALRRTTPALLKHNREARRGFAVLRKRQF